MSDDDRLQSLIDEILESGRTPEELCGQDPELLAEVRRRLRRLRGVEAQIDALFHEMPAQAGEPGGPRSESDADLPPIPGYAVESILGRGGMGVVYRARHLRLNRDVALKMLISGAWASAHERQRFLREAESVAGLRHANIVQLYDIGDFEGRPYFTMELIEGGSLALELAGKPRPARDAARFVATLARAVDVAHKSGIVHRDLKPANILLAADGTPKIADFGLARRFDAETSLTLSGSPVGTPSYMAPEQAAGRNDAIGPTTDVYALGAILYEMLTGRPPFRGESAAETERQVINDLPVPPVQLNPRTPRDLQTICLKCLQKAPSHRYGTALELAEDLDRFLADRPIRARPVGRGERTWRWCRRNPTSAALVGTGLALVGLASGGGVWIVQQRAERRVEVARYDLDLRNGVATALPQVVSLRRQYHFREARELLEFAGKRLEQAAGPGDLRRLVDQCRADLDLTERLDVARIEAATFVGKIPGMAAIEPLYIAAFAEAGLGRAAEDSKVVSARVRASPLRAELIATLDNWASITLDRGRRQWLLEVARDADQDPARNRLRQPDLWQDGARLTQLALEPSAADVSPQLAISLDRAAHQSGGDAMPLLTAVQARYPQEFWINFVLGLKLCEARRWDEAIGYCRAALAIRPEVSAAHNALAVALLCGRFDVEGNPTYSEGRREEAIGQVKEALRLDPNNILAHINLGSVLGKSGQPKEAAEHFQQALRLDPKSALAQVGLSAAIFDALEAAADQGPWKGRLDESERTRLRLQALDWLRTYLELAIKLQDSGERASWSPANWQTDSALASVRDPAELAKLPAPEREQWQRLWADVAAFVAADPLAQGRALAARREWAHAAERYARALSHGPTDDGHFWFEFAALSLLSGDRPGYNNACVHMIESCGKSGGPRAYHVARACTLAPDAVSDLSLPARLAEQELAQSATQFWSLTEQGALAFRAGRFEQSAQLFEQSLQADAKPGRAVINWLWLSMADQKLGKTDEAGRWLEKAQSWLGQFTTELPPSAEAQLGLHLHNWLEAQVLCREAAGLLRR
jgi:serine/threonine-protein kinase